MADRSKGLRIRLRAKSTSKILERDLRKKARKLKGDPYLLLPTCMGECSRCPFEKMKRALRKVAEKADNPEALERLSRSGDKMARALAGFLKILHEERIPYLALARTPEGEVGYVQRGKAPTNMMIAVQYYDRPTLKALGYLDYVRKKGLTMFITERALLCSGGTPKINEDVERSISKAFEGKLKSGGGKGRSVLHCPHLEPGEIEDLASSENPYIRLSWSAGGLLIGICEECIREIGGNSYHRLGRVVMKKKLKKEVEVSVQVSPVKRSEKCPEVDYTLPSIIDYISGEMDDLTLIKRSKESYREILKSTKRRVFIARGVCYGDDPEVLLKALGASGKEKELLAEVLKGVSEPLVVEDLSSIAVLRRFWKERGRGALAKVLGDEEVAEEIFSELSLESYTPGAMIEEGMKRIREKNLRKKLPEPVDPPEMIEVARELAIAYMARGPEGVGRVLSKLKTTDIRTRAAVYAFIKAFSLEKYSSWSYSPEEIGYAQGLEDVIKEVVTDDGERHKDALRRLWRETGSTLELRFRGE